MDIPQPSMSSAMLSHSAENASRSGNVYDEVHFIVNSNMISLPTACLSVLFTYWQRAMAVS